MKIMVVMIYDATDRLRFVTDVVDCQNRKRRNQNSIIIGYNIILSFAQPCGLYVSYADLSILMLQPQSESKWCSSSVGIVHIYCANNHHLFAQV